MGSLFIIRTQLKSKKTKGWLIQQEYLGLKNSSLISQLRNKADTSNCGRPHSPTRRKSVRHLSQIADKEEESPSNLCIDQSNRNQVSKLKRPKVRKKKTTSTKNSNALVMLRTFWDAARRLITVRQGESRATSRTSRRQSWTLNAILMSTAEATEVTVAVTAETARM